MTLTGTQVRNTFGVGYEYPQLRDIMMDHARDAGLRPSGPADQSRPKVIGESVRAARDVPVVPADEVPDRPLSRAERDELYGLAPGFEVIHRESERRPRTAEDTIRQLFPSMR